MGQEYTSAKTCVNQIPAAFKKIAWQPGTRNLDYGGGKYNTATEYLLGRYVFNFVYDPYNRDEFYNSGVLIALRKQPADTATICNVLNVIKEPEVRRHVLENVKALVRRGGEVYISVFRGKNSPPGPTCNGWQENRALGTYLREVRDVYSDAEMQRGMIVAHV